MTRHILSLSDFSHQEITGLVDRAIELKRERQEGIPHNQLSGRIIGLVFEKPSTRTRVSFEAAMYGMGGQVIFLSARDTQLARSEPLKDMSRVMSRYVDGLVVRTFGQEIVEELAEYATVPVINALTDLHHPCQVLSDMMTVVEEKGAISGLKICWVGDGNNMANSWLEAAALMDFELSLACPEGYDPDPVIFQRAQAMAKKPITLVRDPHQAVAGADAVNVDVWVSMGQEAEQNERLSIFAPYQVNRDLLNSAQPDTIVLHCLPAHRDEEITEEVLESDQSVVFDQAENKMHMHQAILEKLIS